MKKILIVLVVLLLAIRGLSQEVPWEYIEPISGQVEVTNPDTAALLLVQDTGSTDKRSLKLVNLINMVEVAAGSDNQTLLTNGTPGNVSIQNGNSITINVSDNDSVATNELDSFWSLAQQKYLVNKDTVIDDTTMTGLAEFVANHSGSGADGYVNSLGFSGGTLTAYQPIAGDRSVSLDGRYVTIGTYSHYWDWSTDDLAVYTVNDGNRIRWRSDVTNGSSISTRGASGYVYFRLSGDSNSPGNSKHYGTSSIGTKGWYDDYTFSIYAGSTTKQISSSDVVKFIPDVSNSSIQTDATESTGIKNVYFKLTNDATSPGANKVYGTDGLGIKGWKNDPSGGSSLWTTRDDGIEPLTASNEVYIGNPVSDHGAYSLQVNGYTYFEDNAYFGSNLTVNTTLYGYLGSFSGDVSVSDEVYDVTAWNGSTEVPTKNAVRDELESMKTTPAFIGCEVYASATQTSTSTGTTQYFAAESYDTNSFHSTSSNTSRITIPTELGVSLYRVEFTGRYGTQVDADGVVHVLKNGTSVKDFDMTSVGGTGVLSANNFVNVVLSAGDYIEIKVTTSSSLTSSTSSTITPRFAIQLLRRIT